MLSTIISILVGAIIGAVTTYFIGKDKLKIAEKTDNNLFSKGNYDVYFIGYVDGFSTNLYRCKLDYKKDSSYFNSYDVSFIHNNLISMAEIIFMEKGIDPCSYDKIVASVPSIKIFNIYKNKEKK